MPNSKVITTTFISLLIVICVIFYFNREKTYIIDNPNIDQTQKEQGGISFLILGKTGDTQGGQWHTSPDLTDTIILAYYQPSKEVLNLISLPRDLYADFNSEKFKINEAIKKNKTSDLLIKVSQITGIQTNKFAVIDLEIVKKVVDKLGGVDIVLPSAVTDAVTKYTMEAGQQHLTGEDVIWLIRNRFASQGDFFREKNQQLVIEALYQKYKNLSQAEKIKLAINLMPDLNSIQTNSDFFELFSLGQEIKNVRFKGITLDFTTGLLESSSTSIVGVSTPQYILLPKAGLNKYDEIKNYIAEKIKSD